MRLSLLQEIIDHQIVLHEYYLNARKVTKEMSKLSPVEGTICIFGGCGYIEDPGCWWIRENITYCLWSSKTISKYKKWKLNDIDLIGHSKPSVNMKKWKLCKDWRIFSSKTICWDPIIGPVSFDRRKNMSSIIHNRHHISMSWDHLTAPVTDNSGIYSDNAHTCAIPGTHSNENAHWHRQYDRT